MRNTWLVACVFVLGCHDVSKDIEKLADRACECKDKTCADKVIDDLVDFAKSTKNAHGDQDRAAKAVERLGMCVMKAGADPQSVMEKMKGLGD